MFMQEIDVHLNPQELVLTLLTPSTPPHLALCRTFSHCVSQRRSSSSCRGDQVACAEPKASGSRRLGGKFRLTCQASVSPGTNSSSQAANAGPHQIFCDSWSRLVCCIIIIMCVSTGESAVMEALGDPPDRLCSLN